MVYSASSTGGQTFADRFGDLIFEFGKSFSDGFVAEKFAPTVPAPTPDATDPAQGNTWVLAAIAAAIGVGVAVYVARA